MTRIPHVTRHVQRRAATGMCRNTSSFGSAMRQGERVWKNYEATMLTTVNTPGVKTDTTMFCMVYGVPFYPIWDWNNGMRQWHITVDKRLISLLPVPPHRMEKRLEAVRGKVVNIHDRQKYLKWLGSELMSGRIIPPITEVQFQPITYDHLTSESKIETTIQRPFKLRQIRDFQFMDSEELWNLMFCFEPSRLRKFGLSRIEFLREYRMSSCLTPLGRDLLLPDTHRYCLFQLTA